MFNILAQAGPASSPIPMIVMLVGMLVFFYFFIIRPQNKKKKEMQNMLDSMAKGDKVITIGGLHGKIVTVKDLEIVLRVDSNTELTFEKSAISKVIRGGTVQTSDKKIEDNRPSPAVLDKKAKK